jgi:hypothetical protein
VQDLVLNKVSASKFYCMLQQNLGGGGADNSTVLKIEENSRLDIICRNFRSRVEGHIISASLLSHNLKVGNR